jgi:dihydroorotase-like cyclic amidohydrolase/DNA-binding XRE family transcriptional regulator
MRYDVILKNGTLVTPSESFKADIAVKNGKIARTGKLENDDTADDVYDAAGKHILPGIIDAHVHFRDPGLCEKEDFESGSMAAAFGGVTTIADMPNVLPVTSTVRRFDEKLRIAGGKSYIDFGFFALLSDDNTCETEGLIKAGALGFKVFLGTSTGDIAAPSPAVLYEHMKRIAESGLRTGFHAETGELNAHFTSLCKKKENVPEGLLLSEARPVFSEALAMAKEALDGCLEVDISQGNTVPQPSYAKGYPITVANHIVVALQLRELRGEQSQTDIARKLGLSYQAYQRLENPRKANPTVKTLEKIARVYGRELNISL